MNQLSETMVKILLPLDHAENGHTSLFFKFNSIDSNELNAHPNAQVHTN